MIHKFKHQVSTRNVDQYQYKHCDITPLVVVVNGHKKFNTTQFTSLVSFNGKVWFNKQVPGSQTPFEVKVVSTSILGGSSPFEDI